MSVELLDSLPKPTALVCGSGGLNAAAQAGMLQAIEPWQPDLVVGSSGGALTAAGLDGSENPAAGVAEVWRELASSGFPYVSFGRVVSAVSGRETSKQTRKIEELLQRLFGEAQLADDGSRAMVATNLNTGLPTVITAGPVAKAVQASAAFPMLVNPVERDGTILVDGSFSASLPVGQAYELGAKSIVALDTGRAPLKASQVKQIRWFEVVMVSVNHQVAANAAHDVAAVAARIPIVMLSVADPFRIRLAELDERIELGGYEARRQLQAIAGRWATITEPGVYAAAEEVVADRRLSDMVR
jgi:NTE family protein